MTRHPLILAAVAGALALCACGSDAGGRSANAGGKDDDKAFEGALKFAKCMREHGVDVPDPTKDSKGGISVGVRVRAGQGGEPGTPDPKVEKAQAECGHFMEAGGGEPRDPAQEARMQDALFAYARCMRAEGIDMPDPQVNGGRVMFKMGTKGEQGPGGGPESPQFKAADKVCHKHLAAIEEMREGAEK
jgi:hypothetical protein